MSTYYLSVTAMKIREYKPLVSYGADMKNFRLLWKISMPMACSGKMSYKNTHTEEFVFLTHLFHLQIYYNNYTLDRVSLVYQTFTSWRENGDMGGAYISSWEEGKIEVCCPSSGLVFCPLGHENRVSGPAGVDWCQRAAEENRTHQIGWSGLSLRSPIVLNT